MLHDLSVDEEEKMSHCSRCCCQVNNVFHAALGHEAFRGRGFWRAKLVTGRTPLRCLL